jgi:hypothetical protein
LNHDGGEVPEPLVLDVVVSWDGVTTLTYFELQVQPREAPSAVPEVPPAFSEPPDPPELKLCRPCSDKNVIEKPGVGYYGVKETERALIHACDGNGCQCALCAIAQTAREMTDEWDLFDRADQWRD